MTYINPLKNPDIDLWKYNKNISNINNEKFNEIWSIISNTSCNSTNMTFSEALVQLKKRSRLKRKNWNSYLTLGYAEVPSALYKTLSKEQKDLLYNFIKDGKPYTITKEDILAEDWEIETFEIDPITVKY